MSDDRPDSMRWHVHGERTIYDNPWVQLVRVDVEPPGGGPRFEHHVVRLNRTAIAVVLDDADRVLMLWRHRFVTDQWGWELPGGIVEAGEDGAVTAARETEEETGWRPGPMRHVITYQPMIGMVDTPHSIYLAHGADFVAAPEDSEENARIEWVPLVDVPDLMARGELLGSGTLVGLLHVLASRTAGVDLRESEPVDPSQVAHRAGAAR